MMDAPRLLRAAAVGYRDGRPAQRGVLGVSSSFALTMATTRTINYVRERRRAFPRLRSIGRRLYHVPRAATDRRVHHFIPGIGLGFATGAAAILTRNDGLDRWLSLPFGAALALTTDELGLLLESSNPYWGSENFALAQAAAASLTAAGMVAVFVRRGLMTRAPSGPSGEQSDSQAPGVSEDVSAESRSEAASGGE